MEIEWSPKFRQLLSTGVTVPLDGPEDEAVDDVLRQLAAAGVEPNRDEVTIIVREERSKPTES